MLTVYDLVVLAVLTLFAFLGWRKGLLLTLFRLVSFFAAIILTIQIYPYVSRFLRGTFIYAGLRDTIIKTMGIDTMVHAQTANLQAEAINALPLPNPLLGAISSYNTPDVYNLLDVRSFEEYVGGYIANIAINVVSAVCVFALVLLLLKAISGVLDVIGRLPVINTFNRAGGLIAGLIQGTVIVWVLLSLSSLLMVNENYPELLGQLRSSAIAGKFYDINLLLRFLTKV